MTDSNQPDPISDVEAVRVAFGDMRSEIITCIKLGSPTADIEKFINDMRTNTDLQQKLVAAEGALKNLPADMKQLGIFSEIHLGYVALTYIPKISKAIKG